MALILHLLLPPCPLTGGFQVKADKGVYFPPPWFWVQAYNRFVDQCNAGEQDANGGLKDTFKTGLACLGTAAFTTLACWSESYGRRMKETSNSQKCNGGQTKPIYIYIYKSLIHSFVRVQN